MPRFYALSLAALVLLAFGPAADAQTPSCSVSWINPSGGDWSTPPNWDTGAVPTATDDVCIGDLAGAAYEVSLSGSGYRNVARLTLGATAGAQTLRLSDGAGLSASGDILIEPTGLLTWGDRDPINVGGALVVQGEARQTTTGILGSGDLTVEGGATIEGGGLLVQVEGRFTFNGGATIQPGGVFEWEAGGLHTGPATEVLNEGTLHLAVDTDLTTVATDKWIAENSTIRNRSLLQMDGRRLFFQNESALINEASGLIELLGDGLFDPWNQNDIEKTFENAGTLRKVGGTGQFLINTYRRLDVINTGTLHAQVGEILMTGAVHENAVFDVDAGALIDVTGAGSPHFPTEISGTLTGDVQGTLRFRALVISDDATLDFSGEGALFESTRVQGALTNARTMKLKRTVAIDANATLVNRGTAEFVDFGPGAGPQFVRFEGPESVFVNEAGATFDVQFDGIFLSGSGGSDNVFNNRGTFVKSGGTGTTTVTTGALSFNNNGVVRAETGTIQFAGDVANTHEDPTFTALGGAKVEFRGGTHVITGTMRGDPEGTVSLTRATITGGVLDMGGTGLEWQQGGSYLSGITNRGLVRTTGGFASRLVRTGETLTNEGTFRIEGAGVVLEGAGSRFVNAAGGVYDLATGSSLGVETPADDATFDNYGTILSSEGNGTPTFNRVEVVSHPGSAVRLEDGGLKFSGRFDLREGAVLEGVGSVEFTSTSTTLLDGTISPGLSPGILTLSYFSALDLDPGTTLAIEIAGTGEPGAPDGYDQLVMPATGTTLDGTLEITVVGDPALSIGDTFLVLAPRSNGTISGEFSTVIQPPGYTFEVTYGDGVTLTLVGLAGETGVVSGQVTTEGNGLPIEGAFVQLWADGGDGPEVRAWAQTDASGQYHKELTAGTYRAFAFAAGHAGGWYDGAATYEDATPLSVGPGPAVSADLALAPAAPGAIAGTLTDAETGTPIPGVLVRAWKRGLPAASYDARTGSDGTFRLDPALPGEYVLRFFDPLGRYPTVYYDGATDPDEATLVAVEAGQTATASAALPPSDAPIVVRGVWSSGPGPNGTVQILGFRNVTGPVSFSARAGCSNGSVPESVDLVLGGGDRFAMEEDPVGSQWYTATLQAPTDIRSGDLGRPIEIRALCNGQEETTGTLNVTPRLYDPAGQITDAETGLPVQGAVVQLYRVPGFRPEAADDPEGTAGVCETTETREGGVWSQPAPVALGVGIDPATSDSLLVSPRLSAQVTSSEGRYAWDVAEGCWYVTVTASGYLPLTSPVVGVPPPVLDLDLVLTPDGSAAPDAVVLPALLAFGEVEVGAAAVQPVVVRNTGRAALTVDGASLVGPDAGTFSLEGSAAFAVEPGESRAVALSFRPSATGDHSATLRLGTDDPDAPQIDIALRGLGTAPTAADAPDAPSAFALGAAYPNPLPAAAAATLPIDVPEPSAVRVVVYDALGRAVARLVDGELSRGRHVATLDASALPAGVYVVEMRTGSFTQTRRVTVMR